MNRIPSQNDLKTLNFAHQGKPFVHLEAKLLNTPSLDFAWRAKPFVAPWQIRHRRIFLIE
jgi:hypothetical protein